MTLNQDWFDDFSTVSDGYGGWSASRITDGEFGDLYHGFWWEPGEKNMFRYFTVESYARIQVRFTYVWGCDPEYHSDEYGDYAYVYIGGQQSDMITWDADNNQIYEITDSSITANCTDGSNGGQDYGWGQDFVFDLVTEPTTQFQINFVTDQTAVGSTPGNWNEYWGVRDIEIFAQEVCQIDDFFIDSTGMDQESYITV